MRPQIVIVLVMVVLACLFTETALGSRSRYSHRSRRVYHYHPRRTNKASMSNCALLLDLLLDSMGSFNDNKTIAAVVNGEPIGVVPKGARFPIVQFASGGKK